MRVTIEPNGLRPIVLVDGSDRNAWAVAGEMCVLSPEPNGLEGWRETPNVKFDDPGEMPNQDGAFWPEETFLERRILTVRGTHMAGYEPGSTELAAAQFRDLLASLSGLDVTVQVDDQSGARRVNGYVAAPATVGVKDEHTTEFTLFITCPDPLKYGRAAHYPVTAGKQTLHLENVGTGNVSFVVSTHDPITSLKIEYAGSFVEWAGDADGLVFDLADGRALDSEGFETGYLIAADAIRIPAGQHAVVVTADAPTTVTIRPGWK